MSLTQSESEIVAQVAEEVMEQDDNRSVASKGSTISSNQEKMECPYCNKDFQIKSMVNHIHSKHHTEFLNGLTKKWLDKADKNEPLQLYWEKSDDFDEVQVTTLYACMGTYKTFMTHERAMLHFKKNPTALKKHNKEITTLKKEYEKKKEKEKKERAKNPVLSSFRKAAESNDKELIKGMYRYALHLLPILDQLISYVRKEVPMDMVSNVGNEYGEKLAKMDLRSLITLYEETKGHLHDAMNEQLMKYNVIHSIIKRLERILQLREICIWSPRFAYYKSSSNPDGMLLSGEECHGFVHPSMPPCPF